MPLSFVLVADGIDWGFVEQITLKSHGRFKISLNTTLPVAPHFSCWHSLAPRDGKVRRS
jgi:hypothetical protein